MNTDQLLTDLANPTSIALLCMLLLSLVSRSHWKARAKGVVPSDHNLYHRLGEAEGKYEALEAETGDHQDHLREEIAWLRKCLRPEISVNEE